MSRSKAAAALRTETTAEDVKEVVRRYCNEHFPGWRATGVAIRIGEIGEDDYERLLVLPATDAPLQSHLPRDASILRGG